MRTTMDQIVNEEQQKSPNILASDEQQNISLEGKKLRWEGEMTECAALLHHALNQVNERIGDIHKTREQESLQQEEKEKQRKQEISELKDYVTTLTGSCTEINERIAIIENKIKFMDEDMNSDSVGLLTMQRQIATEIVPSIGKCTESIKTIEEKLGSTDRELQRVTRTRATTPTMLNSSMSVQPRLKFKPPTFKGDAREKPMKFLSELRKYIDVTNPEFREAMYLISQTLEGPAKDWWYLMENNVVDINDFERKFKERFWNATIQDTLRRRIEFGKYDPVGKMSRVDYATNMFGIAKDLGNNQSDAEIIRKISTHFDREVRFAIRGRSFNKKEELFELLEDFDSESAVRRGQMPTVASNARHPTPQDDRTTGYNNNNRNGQNPARENREKGTENWRRPGQQQHVDQTRWRRETPTRNHASVNVVELERSEENETPEIEDNTNEEQNLSDNSTNEEHDLDDTMRELNIRTIFEDPRKDLLTEEDRAETRVGKCRCPETRISIEGVEVNALIDTGSEVTCISGEFYETNKRRFKKCPTLPLSGKMIKGATGDKSARLKIQVQMKTIIGNTTKDVIYLVIPKLVKDCILGYDTHRLFQMMIDTHEEVITMKEKMIRIPYREENTPPDNCEDHTMQVNGVVSDEDEAQSSKEEIVNASDDLDTANFQNEIESSDPLQISDEEIEEKINSCTEIDDGQKQSLKNLIRKYQEIFEKKPGVLARFEYELRMVDNEAIVTKPYPIPMKYREKVRDEVKRMMEHGIIRRSRSPYINPVVIVIKKDGSVRICLDARELNKKLIDDHESPQGIAEVFQKCNSVKIMTSLDLTSSFWQIPLKEESKKVTAFRVEGQCFEFNVTPFGLKTSSAALIRGLRVVLQGLSDYVINFVDDLLVISRSFEEHLEHLENLFIRFRENNMTLSFKKSNFAKKETEFLGHVLSADGLKPQPDKIQIIKDYRRPKNVKQLRGFLGFINFYAKFAKNYAEETAPLLKLVKKGVKYEWTNDHQEAFERIKALFMETMILAHPDPRKPYVLTTDASDVAVGAVLSQRNDAGEEEVVTFISRTLKGAEVGYFTTEKELLAIVWALEKLSTYLRGAKILIRTDHQALTFIKTSRFTNARLRRWMLAIQDYDIEIEYITGKKNVVADVLSRCYHHGIDGDAGKDEEIQIATILMQKPSKELIQDVKNIKQLQSNDPEMQKIISELTRKTHKATNHRYILREGILCKRNSAGNDRIMLPKSCLVKLATEVHETYGHVGAKKVYRMIMEDFAAKKLRHNVEKLIAVCDTCQRQKHSTQACQAKMQNIVPEGPGDLLSIDFYGPLPTSRAGAKHILVTLDAFSKLVVLYAIKRANTETTIRKIFNDYIPKYGKPRRIQCDHGTQFTSVRWANKLKNEDIELVFSSIRHPQGNIVERVNRELGRFFRTLVEEKHTGWAMYTEKIQNCLNETHHETTELTPLELHMNVKPTRIWEKWLPVKLPHDEIAYETKLYLAKDRIKRKGDARAQRFNRAKTDEGFEETELVLVKANNVSDAEDKKIAKFFAIYEGPYEIEKKIGAATYLLRDPTSLKQRGRFHAANLKRYRHARVEPTSVTHQQV